MIRRLIVNRDLSQNCLGVVGGRENHITKRFRVNMVRATERRERASRFQQFHRANVDFLVAAKRIWNGVACACERGWIQNDQVIREESTCPFGPFCVRFFQPVKNVHFFERALLRNSIHLGVFLPQLLPPVHSDRDHGHAPHLLLRSGAKNHRGMKSSPGTFAPSARSPTSL